MKKLSVIMTLVLIGSMAVFAGGGKEAKGASAKVFIGLAMPETHVERWQKDGESLKKGLEAKGYAAEVQYGNADQATQNQQIQSFLTQGAKALIIGNINDGVGSVVEEASKGGVKVIAYDRIIQNTTNYDYYITFNNYAVGTLQGEAIKKALNLDAATTAAPKYITYFAGSPTDANANFFFQGAADVLNPYIDKGVLKIVGPKGKSYTESSFFQAIATENWSGPAAKQRMEGLLVGEAKGVTLDAVLAPNDTLARAIIEALKADAKYRAKLPFVTGQDAEADSVVSIKNGEQGMTVFKDTSKLAEAAVLIADALAKGQKPVIPGATEIYDSGPLKGIADVTPSNLNDNQYVHTFLLTPIGVTKDNWKTPVDAGFYDSNPAEKAKLQ
ncbi:MAG: sugar-binding protein [Spirochaetaceae bacterium]|nr:sugar-binding protein [Spirochaetaceae bacterium]